MLNVDDKAPDFSLPSDSGREVSLQDFKGHPLILYFFPKADTPG
jgi:peroxiredoxin Q/BCP